MREDTVTSEDLSLIFINIKFPFLFKALFHESGGSRGHFVWILFLYMGVLKNMSVSKKNHIVGLILLFLSIEKRHKFGGASYTDTCSFRDKVNTIVHV